MRFNLLGLIRRIPVLFLLTNGYLSFASCPISVEEVRPLIHAGELVFEVTRRPAWKRKLEVQIHGAGENYRVHANLARAITTSLKWQPRLFSGRSHLRPFVSAMVFGKTLQRETDLFGENFVPGNEPWERPLITPLWQGRISVDSRSAAREFASRVLYGAEGLEDLGGRRGRRKFSVGLVGIIRRRILRLLTTGELPDDGKLFWLGFSELRAGKRGSLKSLETESRLLVLGRVKRIKKEEGRIISIELSIFVLPAGSVELTAFLESRSPRAREKVGVVVDAAASLIRVLLEEEETVPVVAVGAPLQMSPALCQLSLASELLASIPIFSRSRTKQKVKGQMFEQLFSDSSEDEVPGVPDWNSWEAVEASLKEASQKKKLGSFLKMLLRDGPLGNLLGPVADFYREASLWVAEDGAEGGVRYMGKI